MPTGYRSVACEGHYVFTLSVVLSVQLSVTSAHANIGLPASRAGYKARLYYTVRHNY